MSATAEPQVVDAEVVEENGTDMAALVTTGGPAIAVIPDIGAGDLVERLGVIKTAAQEAMTEGVDYGKIPGTDKDCLFKPGAEKLGVLFQLDVQIHNEKVWGPDDHLTVMSKATAFHAPSGTRVGFGEGLCSTREKKYAVRAAKRKCPHCQEEAVIKGKKEYGGGWLCWNKPDKGMNGCGAKWQDGDAAIESQQVGDIPNPDLPDTWNTVIKMAEKRARVDVVLAVTGASALFTQDIEDEVVTTPPTPPVEETPPAPPVERPYDWNRFLVAASKLDNKQVVGKWLGFDGKDPKSANPEKLKTAIERCENGDAAGLMKLIEADLEYGETMPDE